MYKQYQVSLRRIQAVVILMLFVFCFGVARMTAAQELHGEHVTRFHSAVQLRQDNTAIITETIEYDFDSLTRHGIYRTIPVDYKDGSKVYKLAFEHMTTKDSTGRNITTEVSTAQGNKVLKIGDADTTVTGVQTYVITYKLWPLVTRIDGVPKLLLDINGNGWDVPMGRVSAAIHLDNGARLENVTCSAGALGSTNTNCEVQEGASVRATAHTIRARESLTVSANVPEGYVSEYLQAGARRPMTKDDIKQYVVFALVGMLVALGLGLYILRRWRARSRRKAQTIVPEYEPPKNMKPAEVGFLQDDIAEMREITATLIDLAIRGYITIKQVSKKTFFKTAQYSLHKRKDFSGIADYERVLLEELFSNGDDVTLADIDKAGMAVAVGRARTMIDKRLTDNGLYNQAKNEPGLLQKALDAGTISESGAEVWAKIEGFRLYLSVAEKDRLHFTDAPERTPERFSALLPYAVALGVEKEWAKQFEGIDVSPATGGWYTGTTPYFAASALSTDISRNFLTAVSSNAAVSTSSGGSGISSGGGFGGGGGGSW